MKHTIFFFVEPSFPMSQEEEKNKKGSQGARSNLKVEFQKSDLLRCTLPRFAGIETHMKSFNSAQNSKKILGYCKFTSLCLGWRF